MRIKRMYWILSIIVMLIACILLFNYFYGLEKKSKIKEIVRHQKIQARLAAKNFEQIFDKWNGVLYYLSKDSNIIAMNRSAKNDLNKIYIYFKNEIKGITRVDSLGKIIYSIPTSSKAIGADISNQQHIKNILRKREPVVSDVFFAVQGFQAISIHYPVFDNGKFNGTISILLDFEKITRLILEEIKLGEAGFSWLLTGGGVELFCHHNEHVGKKINQSHPLLENLSSQMLNEKEGEMSFTTYNTDSSKNENFVYYLPIKVNNTFWSLAISNSEAEITASLVDFRNRLIIIFIFVFTGIIVLTYYGIKAWIIIKESQLRTIAENKLKENEEKYRTIIEATNTGFAIIDYKRRLIDANPKYAEMTGFSKVDDILGKTIEDITIPRNNKHIQALIDNCIKEDQIKKMELEFIHEKGSIIPVEITASILHTKLNSIILICRNLTEQKKAREELMKERTWLRTLIDNLPSGVFIKDAQYRKIIANSIHLQCVKSHLKSIGIDPDFEVLGKTDFEVYKEEDAELYMLDDSKVIEKGHSIINQVEPGLGPNNEKIWLLVSKVPLRAQDGTIIGMVGITTDITDQKIVEEQLTLAKDKAEQSDKLKTAFLNNISHEIRTPLNAIMGFSNLLKGPDISKEKSDYFIDIIQQSSNQLLHIITDIINIATIETGQLTVNHSKVDINSVLSILYEQYKGQAAFKKLTFNFSTALSNSDAVIETDSTKFTEVFSNVINNAIKFTEKGSVLFGYQLEQDTLIFFVEDNGIGIPKEYHSTIFDRFRQVDGPVSQKYGGTGLGLSISKTYIELLGGSIWLKSEVNDGSTFYFTLPYKKVK